MKDLVVKAAALAREAHAPHKRKYSGAPYIVHPAAVAHRVAKHSDDPEVIAAAWLHDVIEDCNIGHGELAVMFGPVVASYVLWLSNIKDPNLNRKVRKAIDRERLSKAPAEVHLIKVCDLLDNSPSIIEHDPHFAPVFIKEVKALVKVLNKAPEALLAEINKVIEEFDKAKDC